MGGGEGEEIHKGVGGVHHGEKPDDDIADDHIQHQVGDAEAGMLITKEVNFSAEPFQIKSAPVKYIKRKIPLGFILTH